MYHIFVALCQTRASLKSKEVAKKKEKKPL